MRNKPDQKLPVLKINRHWKKNSFFLQLIFLKRTLLLSKPSSFVLQSTKKQLDFVFQNFRFQANLIFNQNIWLKHHWFF